MNESVRQYLREIGRKGGKAGTGSQAKREAGRRNALRRAVKSHPAPKKITPEKILEKII